MRILRRTDRTPRLLNGLIGPTSPMKGMTDRETPDLSAASAGRTTRPAPFAVAAAARQRTVHPTRAANPGYRSLPAHGGAPAPHTSDDPTHLPPASTQRND